MSGMRARLAVIGATTFALVTAAALSPEPGGEAVTAVSVERGQITVLLAAPGSVRAATDVVLTPGLAGTVVAVHTAEGEAVRAGDAIVSLDAALPALVLERAEAEAAAARQAAAAAAAASVAASQHAVRVRGLLAQGSVPRSALEHALADSTQAALHVEGADYQVAAADVQVRLARRALRETTLRAPRAGTITRLAVEVGEHVVPTAHVEGTPIARISSGGRLFEAQIRTEEADLVRVGDRARVHVPAYSEAPICGRATRVGVRAYERWYADGERATHVPVEIELLTLAAAGEEDACVGYEERRPLAPGVTGTAEIETRTSPPGPIVPFAAMASRTEKDDAGIDRPSRSQRIVFVVEDDTARAVAVETGLIGRDYVEVTQGLQGGEHVIVGPYRLLRRELQSGDPVRLAGDVAAPARPPYASR